ncbi:glycerophosphoryl diester phosphodiesterase [Micrococcus cohnii]|uniref:Glycerophosphoryl diester phosphodiesterase n=1 Tax=Micrococcus cohnii TaxID=993416 RepID=A0A7W7GPM6_9MICC|nr:glycerophosphodiester phosphodiesterase family protein [Micrococcus cohnii]MBB4735996.1 glycerophosphoryl diester phosphodiesterase [Micrococcus cohnii]
MQDRTDIPQTAAPIPRRTVTTALAGAALAGGLHAAPAASAAPTRHRDADRPLIIGHRGAAGTAPENSVSAFRDAVRAKADHFEIDVQLSADGVPFLFHDSTPARTTNVAEVFPGREKDPITSFTWAELQRLEIGSAYSDEFAGERIPHLGDAARVANRNTGVFIEIKDPAGSPGIEQVVADALEQDPRWQRLVAAGKVEVLGFDSASNRRFAELAPDVPLQELRGTVPMAAELAEIATYADSFGTSYRTLDAAGVERVTAAGLEIGVYTVNSVEKYEQMVALGVQRVTTDFPLELMRHVHGLDPFPHGRDVRILDSVNNVPGADLQPETGEHVVLVNDGRHTVDVSGYVLRDAAYNTLTVGEGYVLRPGAVLRVYTGPGTDTEDAYYNGGEKNVLNNGGDSVALFTADGRLLDAFAN